jgi:hypothetical protein
MATENPVTENPATDATKADAEPAPSSDPFAAQRTGSDDPFAKDKLDDVAGGEDMAMGSSPPGGRRTSKEWDASKVPPSQFQKRKGSIYATPSSRDAHISGSDRDKAYFEKLKEKGWHVLKSKSTK